MHKSDYLHVIGETHTRLFTFSRQEGQISRCIMINFQALLILNLKEKIMMVVRMISGLRNCEHKKKLVTMGK